MVKILLLKRPGAFIFLGINNETMTAQLHSPTYNYNDEAIPFGVAYWITLAQQYASTWVYIQMFQICSCMKIY